MRLVQLQEIGNKLIMSKMTNFIHLTIQENACQAIQIIYSQITNSKRKNFIYFSLFNS